MHLFSSLVPSFIFLLITFMVMLLVKIKVDTNFLLLVFITIGYAFLLNIPRNFQELQFVHSKWNWSGKIFATLFAFGCIATFKNRLSPVKVGLTTIFNPGSLKPCLFFTLCYL